MTASQIRWAQAHDWYRGYMVQSTTDKTFIVGVYDSETDSIVQFERFKLLKQWAGY